MLTQYFTGTPTSRRFCPCPAGVTAGMAVLIGKIPAVALDNYQSNEGGTTFLLGGSFVLTVLGSSTESPVTGHQINPGDSLYATGTYDPVTNVTYNLTIDANSVNTAFGALDPESPAVGSGIIAANAIVLLPNGA